MNTIKVERKALLEIIKKNREAHHDIFVEAFANYQKQAIAELQVMLDEAKAGKTIKRAVTLPPPIDMTKDYDRVIRMLDMELRNDIDLNEQDFAQYVMDDWAWKRNFLYTNSTYSGKAGADLAAYGN